MLQVYVSRLRKSLRHNGARIKRHGNGYRLAVEPEELDASRFEALVCDGRASLARSDVVAARTQLEEALALWRGPALAGLTDDAFAREESVRLETLRLSAMEQRVQADLELGRHGEVVEELNELVAAHPFHEKLWEQLMLALYRSGRQADALRVGEKARFGLVEELGIDPGPALRAMEDRILTQDPLLDFVPPERAAMNKPHSLPLQRTSFIGRDSELARVAELLEHSRLLTVIGPPGVGKTRFALQLAEAHGCDFVDGVFFVPLAAVTKCRLVDRALAQSLGLSEVQGESAVAGVKAFFSNREALLILDNFEQVLGAATLVGDLLDGAPRLTIMVTSRAPLQISGEQRFPLAPLEVPRLRDEFDIEDLGQCDAVALFLARARAVDPTFNLDSGNASAIAELTVRLDGLPLAIELAAARTKVLTPHELLSRLERRMLVLTGNLIDVGSRHRTLHDAIVWSYELLDHKEREFFRCLGTFRGGATLSAVADIAGKDEVAALELVDYLMSESLVYRTVDPTGSRFAMLETIREFALRELAAEGEKHDVRSRHARYFLHFAQEVEPDLTRNSSGRVSERVALEADNLRAALLFALEEPEPDLGLAIASCIWRFWQGSERLVEGREWLESLLALPGASDTSRAGGLMALAGVAYWQADLGMAMSTYEEALVLYRALGDSLNVAEALFSMSATANFQGDVKKAEEFSVESRRLFEEEGSCEGIGRVIIAEGFSHWKRGDFAAALSDYEKGVAIARESGDEFMALTAGVGVSVLSFLLGDEQRAWSVMVEIITEASEVHNEHVVVWALELMAVFSVHIAPEESVRLAGAADSLRRAAGGGMVVESFGIEPPRLAAAPMLSRPELDNAWLEGATLTLDEAIALAYRLADAGVNQEVAR